jgi:WhiB family redox-sensing transcriptional regulator
MQTARTGTWNDDDLPNFVADVKPEWWDQALCAGSPVLAWFPARGGGTKPAELCRPCPVRETCLASVMASGERFGIRGGLGERPRRALRKNGEATTRDDVVMWDAETGDVLVIPLTPVPDAQEALEAFRVWVEAENVAERPDTFLDGVEIPSPIRGEDDPLRLVYAVFDDLTALVAA